MTSYLYVALWSILAFYMLYLAIKENRLFLAAFVFFLFMAVWALLDAFLSINLFSGIYGIIYRSVAGVFLVLFVVGYVVYKRKNH